MCKKHAAIEITETYAVLMKYPPDIPLRAGNAQQHRKESIMSLKEKQIGVAFTGSFCTYENVFKELQKLT